MAVTVLLIDGDADCRAISQPLLIQAGYSVLSAPTMPEGMALAPQADIVITEYEIPAFCGECIAARLRAMRVSVPIVVWSSQIAPEVRIAAREADAVFLPKPSAPSRLCALVQLLAPPPE